MKKASIKRILCLVICLLLCTGAVAEEKIQPEKSGAAVGDRLGLSLLSMLHVSGQNTLLSPQSLRFALGMAAAGAEGECLEQLLNALEADVLSEIPSALPEGLKSANAAFVHPELMLKDEYLQRLYEDYSAERFDLNMDSADGVNEWVCAHTDGLIERMFSQAPRSDTGLILINALAMDAQWSSSFDADATHTDVFHSAAGDVSVEMMAQTAYFDYAERDGVQFVRLPYRGGKMEMWVALPAEGGMSALLEGLAEGGLHGLKAGAEMHRVALSLPKFDLQRQNSLSDGLKLLGVENAFSPAADFSAMSDEALYIGDVLQSVRVQVDEEGTRAAAATAVMMMEACAPMTEPPVEMRVDRPFVFLIVDSETESVYFAGTVENPVGE